MAYADAHGRYAKAILIDSESTKKEQEVVEQCETALQQARQAITQHQHEHGCGEATLSAAGLDREPGPSSSLQNT